MFFRFLNSFFAHGTVLHIQQGTNGCIIVILLLLLFSERMAFGIPKVYTQAGGLLTTGSGTCFNLADMSFFLNFPISNHHGRGRG